MNLSYWEERHYFEDNDLVVIGAGIVGLSTAISAKVAKPSMKILVLERSSLPTGASTKNAGFACFGSVTELVSDSDHMTYEEQVALIQMRWEGLELLQCNVSKVELSYKGRGGIEVLDPEDDIQMSALDQINRYNRMVVDAIGKQECFSIIDQTLSSSFYRQAIYNQYEGELNPMNMMTALYKKAVNMGINLLYGQEVKSIESGALQLANKLVKAPIIAICTNGLSKSLLPKLPLQAVRNQVYITEVIQDNPLQSCYHYDQGYIYFREIDGRILIGGARNLYHQQETTSEFSQTDNLKEYLQSFVEEKILCRKTQFEYQWSGILGVGESKAPIIKEVQEGIFVGVRLGGMGIAIGSGVGKKLSEMIVATNY